MPYDDVDATDPMTLTGVSFETDDLDTPTGGLLAHKEMAACFVEEYVRLGFDRERLLHMFRVRGYAGPNLAYRLLGEAVIVSVVDSVLARWGKHAPQPQITRVEKSSCGLGLPVLENINREVMSSMEE